MNFPWTKYFPVRQYMIPGHNSFITRDTGLRFIPGKLFRGPGNLSHRDDVVSSRVNRKTTPQPPPPGSEDLPKRGQRHTPSVAWPSEAVAGRLECDGTPVAVGLKSISMRKVFPGCLGRRQVCSGRLGGWKGEREAALPSEKVHWWVGLPGAVVCKGRWFTCFRVV